MGQELTIIGTLESNQDGQYGPVLKVKTIEGADRTVYPGNKFVGDLPPVGSFGEFLVWETDPAQGRKYGSKYLVEFKPRDVTTAAAVTNGNGNGNGHGISAPTQTEYMRKRTPEDEALIIAQNVYNRSVDLACHGLIKLDEVEGDSKDRVEQVFALARKIKTELENPSWPEHKA